MSNTPFNIRAGAVSFKTLKSDIIIFSVIRTQILVTFFEKYFKRDYYLTVLIIYMINLKKIIKNTKIELLLKTTVEYNHRIAVP